MTGDIKCCVTRDKGAFLLEDQDHSGSMIQDYTDHGESKEPMILLWARIHRFL